MEYHHSAVVGSNAEQDVARVILDYCFFTETGGKNTEAEAGADATSSVTALVM